MKCFMLTADNMFSQKGEMIKMQKTKAIFENEEATRLLNYFLSYKQIVNKKENHPVNAVDDAVRIAVLPRNELLIVK
jgi:hypothetical protein